MNDKTMLREAARASAAVSIFKHMASEEASAKLHAEIVKMSDAKLDQMARLTGIPEDQFAIHRAMVRGEPNAFMEELQGVDGLLKTGDVFLVTGTTSKRLVELQRPLYNKVRSSHAALVHADFVCIDAMPKIGVTNRVVSELLTGVEDDWRVIRCKKLDDHDRVMRACAFYLAQPYKVLPAKRSAKTYAYCSELVRKVYHHCGIANVGIADDYVIAPAHLDSLADGHPDWGDVTESVRPAVEFCKRYPSLVNTAVRLFIEGLKLNRRRFQERTELLAKLQLETRAGKIPKEKAEAMARVIRETESNMNNTFWDVKRV